MGIIAMSYFKELLDYQEELPNKCVKYYKLFGDKEPVFSKDNGFIRFDNVLVCCSDEIGYNPLQKVPYEIGRLADVERDEQDEVKFEMYADIFVGMKVFSDYSFALMKGDSAKENEIYAAVKKYGNNGIEKQLRTLKELNDIRKELEKPYKRLK